MYSWQIDGGAVVQVCTGSATSLHSVKQLFFRLCGNVHKATVCGNVHTVALCVQIVHTVALTQKAAQYSVAASAGASSFMLRVHVSFLFAKKQFFSTSLFLTQNNSVDPSYFELALECISYNDFPLSDRCSASGA